MDELSYETDDVVAGFHFPLYKSIDENALNVIFNHLWKEINIKENRKFKLIF